jgi:uncharacterized damage-inducible protein DinB
MHLDEAQSLIDYHYWARDRVLAAAAPLTVEDFQRDLRNSFPSVRDTLAHLSMTDWIWHARWTGHSPTAPPHSPEEFPTVETVREFWQAQEAKIRSFVVRLPEGALGAEIDYRNMKGQAGRSSFAQMIAHLVNHGSYHRGQVTTMLRQLGAAPPAGMDLIAFFRERAAAGAPRR